MNTVITILASRTVYVDVPLYKKQKKSKVKISLLQAMEADRVARG
jgi:hypothetical protein